jgi:hypothetical protein
VSGGLEELMGRASDPAPDTMTGVLSQYIAEPDSDHTEQTGQAMHRLVEVLTGELERVARHPTVAIREQFRGQLFGNYLGPDAEDAMARFARFAASVSPSIPDQ